MISRGRAIHGIHEGAGLYTREIDDGDDVDLGVCTLGGGGNEGVWVEGGREGGGREGGWKRVCESTFFGEMG